MATIPAPIDTDRELDIEASYAASLSKDYDWRSWPVTAGSLIRLLAEARAENARLRALLPSFPPGSLQIQEPVTVEKPDGTFDVTYRFTRNL